MKKLFPALTLSFLMISLFFSSSAAAKMMNGKVSSVDTTTKKLTLQTTDAATGQVSESEMWVNEGIELPAAGETVWVEVEQDPEGNWKISQVTKG